MAKAELKKIAEKMKSVDFCMMTTQDGRGTFHSRPMSNNQEVTYEGNSYFFTNDETGLVKQLEETSRVSLTYQTDDMLFIHLYGSGYIIRQKARMEPFWKEEMNAWFKDGLDTEGLVMIRVEAKHIRYWHKAEEGEIDL